MNYEQPSTGSYGSYAPATYFALVDQCAILDTEPRQVLAQASFANPADYQAFMKLVHENADLRKQDKDGRVERLSDAAYDKIMANETAQQRRSDEKYAQSGAKAQILVNGAAFLFDGSDDVTAIWGDGDDVILAEGEALMICGLPGVGKTTVVHQFIRARMGCETHALGYAVQPTKSKVLYLACDRPRQARRALKRLFSYEELAVIEEKLEVWQGPPPQDFATHPEALLQMCLEAGADTVVIDSLKDVVQGGLESGEVGTAYNRARQLALVNGITVVELHHQKKTNANGGTPNSLADVYGSTWLTAGAGSVVVLDGNAGDPVVKWRHLKQPVNTIGPLDLYHDHDTGLSSFAMKADLVALARTAVITAWDAAKLLFDTDKPTKAEVQRARRELAKLVKSGQLIESPGIGNGQITWRAAVPTPQTAQAAPEGTLY